MKPLVLKSVNDAGAKRCVDVLRRPDRRYAWAECRRDPEDPSGWREIASSAAAGHASAAEAEAEARAAVAWLAAVGGRAP